MKIEIDANEFCKPDCQCLEISENKLYVWGEKTSCAYCKNKGICENAVQLYQRNENTALKNLEEELRVTKNNLNDVREYTETLERRLKHLLRSSYICSFDELEPFTKNRKNNILDADSLTHFLQWKVKIKK